MSATKPKFCPECGGTLGSNNICEKCGFNAGGAVYKQSEAAKSAKPASGSNGVWDLVGKYLPQACKWAWVIVLVGGIITIIAGLITYSWAAALYSLIPSSMAPYVATLVWQIIGAIVQVAFAIIWVKPKFSKPISEEKYDVVLNDALKLGTIKVPWMWVIGLVLVIFSSATWGWIILGPAIIITFFSPLAPYNWKA